MRIGIIGTGNMGTIITQSLIESKQVHQEKLLITNRTIEKALQLQKLYPNIHVAESVEEVIKGADLIFICAKPLDIYPLLNEFNHLITKDKCVVSITSPISVDQLETLCNSSCVRAIPSITNRSLAGVVLPTYGEKCSDEWKLIIHKILSGIGKPVEINNDITRISSDIVSCGPAFFSFIMQNFVKAAVNETKISEDTALQLITEMFLGMATLIEKGHYTLETLQKKVTVTGGVTGEGIKVLEKHKLETTFREVFKATENKYQEDIQKIREQFENQKV